MHRSKIGLDNQLKNVVFHHQIQSRQQRGGASAAIHQRGQHNEYGTVEHTSVPCISEFEAAANAALSQNLTQTTSIISF